jgi:hypothetical protein
LSEAAHAAKPITAKVKLSGKGTQLKNK